jgi:hypothetical protein
MMLIQMVIRISAGHRTQASGDRKLQQNVLDPFPEVRTVVIHLKIFEHIFNASDPSTASESTTEAQSRILKPL